MIYISKQVYHFFQNNQAAPSPPDIKIGAIASLLYWNFVVTLTVCVLFYSCMETSTQETKDNLYVHLFQIIQKNVPYFAD